jgi:hypothetical protein
MQGGDDHQQLGWILQEECGPSDDQISGGNAPGNLFLESCFLKVTWRPQTHYPGQVGELYGVNAPWYYLAFFKIVKPWLSADILNRVREGKRVVITRDLTYASQVFICSDTELILKKFGTQNLTTDLGGTIQFDLEKWIEGRAMLEGVDLSNPPPLNIGTPMIAAFSDMVRRQLFSFPDLIVLDLVLQQSFTSSQEEWMVEEARRIC